MIKEEYRYLIDTDKYEECLEYSKTDTFIGTLFGEDGQIEVIGWCGDSCSNSAKYYKIKCHHCNDKYGEQYSLYDSLKANLVKGRIPCLCSHNPKNYPYQLVIDLFKKYINENDMYSFVTSTRDERNRVHYHTAEVLCKKHGKFNVKSMFRFMMVKQKCPECLKESMAELFTKDFSEHVDDIIKLNKFKHGTTFEYDYTKTYNAGNRKNIPYVKIICPVCSQDDYVKEGLCSGYFYGRLGNIKNGNMPCRCNSQFKWNTKQREYQVNKIIKENKLPITFEGWYDEKEQYKNYKSRINLKCNEHGVYDIAIDNFLQGYHRCPQCAGKGYSKYTTGYFYIVKWFLDNNVFYKLGITNTPEFRVKQQNRRNKKLAYDIYKLWEFKDGNIPLNLETYLKNKFPLNYISSKIMPDGYTETFGEEYLSDIESSIECFIKEVECQQ